jgi:indolepyruvate ferredoxin oxidoreductase beta subunit
MDKVVNILIVGVGGQGVLLASEVIAETAMTAGLDVKKSEVHGMSQRGGVVSSHVRFGVKVYSPIISYGQADILISLEQAEALRAIDWIRKDGLVVTSETKLVPPIVIGGKFSYPDDSLDLLKKRTTNIISLDADKIALELGNSRLVNILVLGIVSMRLDFDMPLWIKAIKKLVKAKYVELNLKAFALGRELADKV